MTDTPFREALVKAFLAGQQQHLQFSSPKCFAQIRWGDDELVKQYPAEDHAQELLEVCKIASEELERLLDIGSQEDYEILDKMLSRINTAIASAERNQK